MELQFSLRPLKYSGTFCVFPTPMLKSTIVWPMAQREGISPWKQGKQTENTKTRRKYQKLEIDYFDRLTQYTNESCQLAFSGQMKKKRQALNKYRFTSQIQNSKKFLSTFTLTISTLSTSTSSVKERATYLFRPVHLVQVLQNSTITICHVISVHRRSLLSTSSYTSQAFFLYPFSQFRYVD